MGKDAHSEREGMVITRSSSSLILAALRDEVKRQGTNPYQVAKASGLPLTTVQRLLSITGNVPLRNVETLLGVLGLEVRFIATKLSASPRTAHRHQNIRPARLGEPI